MEQKKEFDIVSLIQNEHSASLEKHDIIKKLIFDLLDRDNPWEDIKKFLSFFNDVLLKHFEDEGVVIKFLLDNKTITNAEADIVNTVIKEHGVIIKRINQLNEAGKIYTALLREVKEDFIANAHDLIELVTKHANKEDAEFFPVARKLLSKTDLDEIRKTLEGKRNS
ncbi:MAG TPA: hypothetical protein DCP51_05240 [Clostridiales bacterium]|nr:MAG: hypothetical protein A2044_02045 [Candidatus Firestonebacteria bacterium GWA2_43_8]HAN21063.1 hypothetical protein [Clostridiales bacterium]